MMLSPSKPTGQEESCQLNSPNRRILGGSSCSGRAVFFVPELERVSRRMSTHAVHFGWSVEQRHLQALLTTTLEGNEGLDRITKAVTRGKQPEPDRCSQWDQFGDIRVESCRARSMAHTS